MQNTGWDLQTFLHLSHSYNRILST